MRDAIIQLITALIGSLGFGILFNLHGRKIIISSIGGMLSWGICILLTYLDCHLFTQYFIASVFAILYAEVFARVLKTPTTALLILEIIPLVPGASLYYTISGIIMGRHEEASVYGKTTLICALAIASGIMMVSSIVKIVYAMLYKRKLRKIKDNG